MKILVVRPDRIGDVVVSTPVIEGLKNRYPDSEIYFLVRDAVTPVIEHHNSLSGLMAYQPEGAHRGLSGIARLSRQMREMRFDVAVTLQANFIVSAALFFSGIPLRLGPYSKWFSYLFFN